VEFQVILLLLVLPLCPTMVKIHHDGPNMTKIHCRRMPIEFNKML